MRVSTFTFAASTTDGAIAATPSGAPNAAVAVYGVCIVQGATGTSTLQFNSKPSGAGSLVFALPTLAAGNILVWPTASASDELFRTANGTGLSMTVGAGNTTNVTGWVVWDYV